MIKISQGLLEELLKCFYCGICRAYCPTFESKQSEAWNARGRLIIMKALLESKIGINEEVLSRIYSCSFCKACEINCPSKVRFVDLMEDFRMQLTNAGFKLFKGYEELASNIVNSRNIFGETRSFSHSLQILLKKLPKKAESLLFMGCVASMRYSKFIECLIKCLIKANFQFYIDPEETCCGAFLGFLGLKNDFDRIKKEIVERIKAKRIVTICPMCSMALKEACKELEVLHVSEILNELIEDGRIPLQREVNMHVVYQDPCHLGRYARVYEFPRKILQSIPGLKLKEMERSKEISRCCGGPIRIPFIEIRNAMCKAIFNEAEKMNVYNIVTTCPTCFYNLLATSNKHKIFDLIELIAFSAKLIERIPVYEM